MLSDEQRIVSLQAEFINLLAQLNRVGIEFSVNGFISVYGGKVENTFNIHISKQAFTSFLLGETVYEIDNFYYKKYEHSVLFSDGFDFTKKIDFNKKTRKVKL